MRKNHLSLLLLFLPGGAVLKGQDTILPAVKRTGITELSVQAGWLPETFSSVRVDDFRRLAPQSELLKNNQSNYSFEDYFQGNYFTCSLLAGIQPFRRRQQGFLKNALLRLGIGYYSGRSPAAVLGQNNSTRHDTLISSATGQTFFMDSVISERYYMNYLFQQLRFDGSFLFGTNPDARWRIYTGLGFTTGVSIDAATYIHQRRGADVYVYGVDDPVADEYTSNTYPVRSTRTEEYQENKMNYSVAAYIPLGIGFRIGNMCAANFLKCLHLFYECRPSMYTLTIPELGRTETVSSLQHGFGLKVAW